MKELVQEVNINDDVLRRTTEKNIKCPIIAAV
jgi:hypothetical protein